MILGFDVQINFEISKCTVREIKQDLFSFQIVESEKRFHNCLFYLKDLKF